jgi:predicted flavoprotein YhiN
LLALSAFCVDPPPRGSKSFHRGCSIDVLPSSLRSQEWTHELLFPHLGIHGSLLQRYSSFKCQTTSKELCVLPSP